MGLYPYSEKFLRTNKDVLFSCNIVDDLHLLQFASEVTPTKIGEGKEFEQPARVQRSRNWGGFLLEPEKKEYYTYFYQSDGRCTPIYVFIDIELEGKQLPQKIEMAQFFKDCISQEGSQSQGDCANGFDTLLQQNPKYKLYFGVLNAEVFFVVHDDTQLYLHHHYTDAISQARAKYTRERWRFVKPTISTGIWLGETYFSGFLQDKGKPASEALTALSWAAVGEAFLDVALPGIAKVVIGSIKEIKDKMFDDYLYFVRGYDAPKPEEKKSLKPYDQYLKEKVDVAKLNISYIEQVAVTPQTLELLSPLHLPTHLTLLCWSEIKQLTEADSDYNLVPYTSDDGVIYPVLYSKKIHSDPAHTINIQERLSAYGSGVPYDGHREELNGNSLHVFFITSNVDTHQIRFPIFVVSFDDIKTEDQCFPIEYFGNPYTNTKIISKENLKDAEEKTLKGLKQFKEKQFKKGVPEYLVEKTKKFLNASFTKDEDGKLFYLGNGIGRAFHTHAEIKGLKKLPILELYNSYYGRITTVDELREMWRDKLHEKSGDDCFQIPHFNTIVIKSKLESREVEEIVSNLPVLPGLLHLELQTTTLPYTGKMWKDNFPSLSTVVLNGLKTLDAGSFADHDSLVSIKLPDITQVKHDAITNCPRLRHALLSTECNLQDEHKCFKDCSRAFQIIKIVAVSKIILSSDHIDCKIEVADYPFAREIKKEAFASCKKLTTVKIPRVPNVPFASFKECSALKEVTLSEATFIGEEAFAGCKMLERIEIPKVQIIQHEAFKECQLLKEVIMPELVHLGAHAFEECTALKAAYFPKLKMELEMCFFSGQPPFSTPFHECTSLTKLTISGSTKSEVISELGLPEKCSIDNFVVPIVEKKSIDLSAYNAYGVASRRQTGATKTPSTKPAYKPRNVARRRVQTGGTKTTPTKPPYKPRTVASHRPTKKLELYWSDKHMQEKWDNRKSDDIKMFIDDKNKKKKDDDVYEV